MRTVVNVSVEKALQRLTSSAMEKAVHAHKIASGNEPKMTTTIRLKHPVKEFYEALAEEMGVSFQAVISIMLTTMVNCQLDEQANHTE